MIICPYLSAIPYRATAQICTAECPCKARCSFGEPSLRTLPALEEFLTNDRGIGLRASNAVGAGVFIGEYIGQRIGENEMLRRLKFKNDHGDNAFYFAQVTYSISQSDFHFLDLKLYVCLFLFV